MGPSAMRTEIEERGLGFEVIGGAPEWPPRRSLEDEYELFFSVLFGPIVGRAVERYLSAEPVDVAVIDCMMPAGLAAAERAGVPTVALVHVLYQQFVEGGMSFFWAEHMETINRTRAELGVGPVSSSADILQRQHLVLALAPREFDVPMNAVPRNTMYVGPLHDQGDCDPAALLEGMDPLVVASFSTTYQHQESALQRVADALGRLPVRGLVTTGDQVDASEIRAPANVRVESFVPHASVLPSAAAVVTHAGLGTVMAALACGVPLVCMPMGREQPITAARVAACGAGVCLDAEADVDTIRMAVDACLTSPAYRQGAAAMAECIRSSGGTTRAVAELEALARRHELIEGAKR
jgi:MGT family glycosyltransferase